MTTPISPLWLDQLTRANWGSFDASAISQLDPLSDECCYQPKFYKAPDQANEVIPALGYCTMGLKMTPGSIIFGFYMPCLISSLAPLPFSIQITDTSLDHEWWDEPIPSLFLANYKPSYLSALSASGMPANSGLVGSFPNLLCAPYPVVGTGLMKVEIWNQAAEAQRIEVVFGVLEVVG